MPRRTLENEVSNIYKQFFAFCAARPSLFCFDFFLRLLLSHSPSERAKKEKKQSTKMALRDTVPSLCACGRTLRLEFLRHKHTNTHPGALKKLKKREAIFMGTYRVRNSGTGLGPLAATDSTGKLAPPVARTVPHRMCTRLSRNASNFGKKSPPQDFPRKIPQTQIKHTREKALCVVMLRTKIVSLPHSLTRSLLLLLSHSRALRGSVFVYTKRWREREGNAAAF